MKLRAILGSIEDEAIADARVKPALMTLLYDQAELFGDLRDGFDDRRSLIEWYQKASVRTVGNIGEGWPPDNCITDKTLVSALVRSPIGDVEPLPEPKAKDYRAIVESDILQPACRKGYLAIRDGANEYVGEDDDDQRQNLERELDPENQKNIAMRPGFQSLDDQQQRALEMMWNGFGSTEDLLDWLHGLMSPSNGEISDNTATEFIADPAAMKYFVKETGGEKAEMYRATVAATVILPAFVAGVKSMDTAELASSVSEGPTTFRAQRA